MICRIVFLLTRVTAKRPFSTVHGQVLTSSYSGAGLGLSETQSEHVDYVLKMECASTQSVAFPLEQEDLNRSRDAPSQAFCCTICDAGTAVFPTGRQLQAALTVAIRRFPASNAAPAVRERVTSTEEDETGENTSLAPIRTAATWSSKDSGRSSVA